MDHFNSIYFVIPSAARNLAGCKVLGLTSFDMTRKSFYSVFGFV